MLALTEISMGIAIDANMKWLAVLKETYLLQKKWEFRGIVLLNF